MDLLGLHLSYVVGVSVGIRGARVTAVGLCTKTRALLTFLAFRLASPRRTRMCLVHSPVFDIRAQEYKDC